MNEKPAGHHGWSLIDGIQGSTVLKDVLHNLEVSNPDYARGCLVGVVSCLVACGMDFEKACQLAWQHAPRQLNADCVPESWHEHFDIGVRNV